MEKKYSLGNVRPINIEQLTFSQIRHNQGQITPAETHRKQPLNSNEKKQQKMKSFYISGSERLGLNNPESRRREYLLLQSAHSRVQPELLPPPQARSDRKEEVNPTDNC
jgi:hypothetical protein